MTDARRITGSYIHTIDHRGEYVAVLLYNLANSRLPHVGELGVYPHDGTADGKQAASRAAWEVGRALADRINALSDGKFDAFQEQDFHGDAGALLDRIDATWGMPRVYVEWYVYGSQNTTVTVSKTWPEWDGPLAVDDVVLARGDSFWDVKGRIAGETEEDWIVELDWEDR